MPRLGTRVYLTAIALFISSLYARSIGSRDRAQPKPPS